MTKEKQTRKDEDRLQQTRLPEKAVHAGLGSFLSESGREHIIVPPLSANI